MWTSSDWLVEPLPNRVLTDLNYKLVFGLTCFNVLLWLTSAVLQFVLIGNLDVSADATSSILLGISAGFSLLIFVVTLGSIYGIYRNTINDIKSFIVLTTTTAVLSLFVFIFHVITLSADSADEQWFGPSGFTIFTGFYVSGQSSLIDFYVYYLWKGFCSELEEARMDRMRQMLRQEQQNQLETLIQTSGSVTLPPSEGTEKLSHSASANNSSDRITYYPPVFV